MEIVECEHCQQRWSAPENAVVVECPHCHEMTGYRVVAEERIERAKWTFDGARTIQEMAFKLRARADQLRKLANDDWELREPVHDDYAYLERDFTENEKDRHTIEVVLPADDDGFGGQVEGEEMDVEDNGIEEWF